MANTVPTGSLFEIALTSQKLYENALQDVLLIATFVSDTGIVRRVDGFWDGGTQWKVRFSPPSAGTWRYTTECSDPLNYGLLGQTGTFTAVQSESGHRFQQHGAIRVSDNGRYLAHADGTPFFYLADTAWNAPLFSTDDEFRDYLDVRERQGFNAVQWVGTQWISAPEGDIEGRMPFTGHERIAINPDVYRRLDQKLAEINSRGMLGVPVLLWAADWGEFEVMRINPGLTLPEDQAIRLARYMVARWGAYHVLWILAGDAEYRGARAERFRRIGRAVFNGREHAPVVLHPNGISWHADEFRDEAWLDVFGYQGCHFGDNNALMWAVYGPPATEWRLEPPRPIINLEPPYENHVNLSTLEGRFSADDVRRAIYWSLLVSPTAGVTYGGHGVWGWDDGSSPPTAHPTSGTPLPWRQALLMPGAEQIRHVADTFQSIEWWRLVPDARLVRQQPGDTDVVRYVAAARSDAGDLALIYVPSEHRIELDMSRLQSGIAAVWVNVRTGQRAPATAEGSSFLTPDVGDWLLLLC